MFDLMFKNWSNKSDFEEFDIKYQNNSVQCVPKLFSFSSFTNAFTHFSNLIFNVKHNNKQLNCTSKHVYVMCFLLEKKLFK